jgi:hypothetical protein
MGCKNNGGWVGEITRGLGIFRNIVVLETRLMLKYINNELRLIGGKFPAQNDSDLLEAMYI